MSLRVERRDRVAVLTLDDPDRRNALTLPLVREVVEALDRLEADPGVGAVVVTGAPPAFCAGAALGDLGAAASGAPAGASGAPAHGGGTGRPDEALRAIYEGFLRVGRCELPTVAAVNGAAVGAGMNLALACDLRVAAESARFDSRFLQLALHPGGGHTWLLHRALGPQGAAALVLFGEVVDGPRAVEVGLAWRCVPDGEVVEVACELAGRAAAVPRELARRTKASLRRAAGIATHDETVEAELGPQLWSLQQPEFAQRLRELQERVRSR